MTVIESPPSPPAVVCNDAARKGTSSLLTGRHRIVHVAPLAVELGFECSRGSLHVELAGELCTSTVGLIQRPLLDLVDLSEAQQLTVDLGGVSFIDGRGISMLLRLRSFAESRGAMMRVTSTSRPVAQIIALCDLAVVLVRGETADS